MRKMTPKEKALELYYEFDKLIFFTDKVHCKDCALLCVEKIITEITENPTNRLDFWEQVKKELLKK